MFSAPIHPLCPGSDNYCCTAWYEAKTIVNVGQREYGEAKYPKLNHLNSQMKKKTKCLTSVQRLDRLHTTCATHLVPSIY